MKIIIAGSRGFTNYNILKKYLDTIIENMDIEEIVSGGARGVDRLGERYAHENNITLKIFPAEWNTYGRSAGYKRNALMGNYADGVIAIWDGVSRGTKHMIDYMHKLNKKVTIFNI